MDSRFVIILLSIFILVACSESRFHAPVINGNIERIPKNGMHKVLSRETLYSIAWRYGLDYRDLAAYNGIVSPYHINSGRLISLRMPPEYVRKSTKMRYHHFASFISNVPVIEDRESVSVNPVWQFPAKGRLIGFYSNSNKGINIAGKRGDPVVAASSGKVVYAGNRLRSYGNLIIIKHNESFLTAYAHNDKILIKEGDWVRGGQNIAEMGNTGARRVMLHFEIRLNGQPVNPLVYLSNQRYN